MKDFDVCIVGAGPAGLAVLSALQTPDAILSNKQRNDFPVGKVLTGGASICVVNAGKEWLGSWNARFAALDIPYLRSPLMAHPDAFSPSALREFAFKHARESEIRRVDYSRTALKGTPEYSQGLYDLPGTELFRDFCDELSDTIPHEFVTGIAESIRKENSDGKYSIMVKADGAQICIKANSVVLALGTGSAKIPPIIAASRDALPAEIQANIVHTGNQIMLNELEFEKKDILVVGGGLSAVQAALLSLRNGSSLTTLCSRRPLVTQQYDVPLTYMNRSAAVRGTYHEFRFKLLELSPTERAKYLKKTFSRGSVPEEYMEDLQMYVRQGRLQICVDEVATLRASPDGRRLEAGFEGDKDDMMVDAVILGTGFELDCKNIPLLADAAKTLNLPIRNGLPILDEDLRWGNEEILVAGAFARVQIGPDAGNLGGAARAAQICASYLGVYDHLYEDDNALGNRFQLFADDDEDDE